MTKQGDGWLSREIGRWLSRDMDGKVGRWVAKKGDGVVARLLATTALWVRIQKYLQNTKKAT
jgi:hypothetical protein